MSDDNKIITLAEHNNRSLSISPEQLLERSLKYLRDNDDGWGDCNAMLILGLNKKDDNYKIWWMRSNLRTSECITLTEASKTLFMIELGYVNAPE